MSESTDERWRLALFCVYCGQPVAIDCEPLPRQRSVWTCPYTGCAKSNPIMGVKVLDARPRESSRRLPSTG